MSWCSDSPIGWLLQGLTAVGACFPSSGKERGFKPFVLFCFILLVLIFEGEHYKIAGTQTFLL